MADQIDELIARTFKITPSEVNDDLEYGSIEGWDSLAHVSLMLQIETDYDVEIDEDTMIELTTVRAIKEYVSRVAA
ncbi:MAG TPA: acyl carrier protein [Lautropia sp.]|jgi:acyl carrier protein|nr:acyl carrier protein [Lautropia sp.]